MLSNITSCLQKKFCTAAGTNLVSNEATTMVRLRTNKTQLINAHLLPPNHCYPLLKCSEAYELVEGGVQCCPTPPLPNTSALSETTTHLSWKRQPSKMLHFV